MKAIFQSIHQALFSLICCCGLLSILPLSAFPTSNTQQEWRTDYPFILMRETVTTEKVKCAVRAQVLPGDVITLNARITNFDDVARNNAAYEAVLLSGMTYVPGSLMVNGALQEPTLIDRPRGYGKTLSVSGLSLAPYRQEGHSLKISFQVKIHGNSPESGLGEFSLSHHSQLISKGAVRFSAVSNDVFLDSKESNAMPYAYLELIEEVQTQESQRSKRVDVQPGDIVTFTFKLTNLGDIEEKSFFSTFLAEGLSYVPNSFSVEGVADVQVTFIDRQLRWDHCVVPPFNATGNPVKISLQAQVESTLPKVFIHSTSFIPESEPLYQYIVLSNPVKLFLK